MRVAAMTGLRRSELCGLRWADVDLGAALATVRQSVQLVGGRIVGRRGEDDAVSVAGSISTPARWPVLRAHRRAQAAERLMVGGWLGRPRPRVRRSRRAAAEPRHDHAVVRPDGATLGPASPPAA